MNSCDLLVRRLSCQAWHRPEQALYPYPYMSLAVCIVQSSLSYSDSNGGWLLLDLLGARTPPLLVGYYSTL
jgi:hypothetical protein